MTEDWDRTIKCGVSSGVDNLHTTTTIIKIRSGKNHQWIPCLGRNFSEVEIFAQYPSVLPLIISWERD